MALKNRFKTVFKGVKIYFQAQKFKIIRIRPQIEYLNNTAAGINGFYEDSASCELAADANNGTMATWISAYNKRESTHEGSEWDGFRPGTTGYDASKFTLLIKTCK